MMSRPPGHRDEIEIRQCIEEFAHGAKQKALAEKFGVKQPTISYWLHRFGKKFMGPKFRVRKQGRPKLPEPSARDKEIIAKCAAGLSFSDAATEYGITPTRVCAICNLWVRRGYRPTQGNG
jgi:hypothetical protein